MEWLFPGALGDARIAQSAIFLGTMPEATTPAAGRMSQFIVRSTSAVSPRHTRGGFTLVELIVATVVLSVGLLALTGAGAAIIRLERRGDHLSRGASAAESRLELLRAEGCSAISGASGAGYLIERWTVTPLSDRIHEIVDSVTDADLPAGAAAHTHVYRSAARC